MRCFVKNCVHSKGCYCGLYNGDDIVITSEGKCLNLTLKTDEAANVEEEKLKVFYKETSSGTSYLYGPSWYAAAFYLDDMKGYPTKEEAIAAYFANKK